MTHERKTQIVMWATLPFWIIPLLLVVTLWPREERIENDYLGNGYWGPIR